MLAQNDFPTFLYVEPESSDIQNNILKKSTKNASKQVSVKSKKEYYGDVSYLI